MFNPDIFAVNLGRTLQLLRATPPDKEHQKAGLRAVYALTSLASAIVRLYDGVLSVDDTVLPADLPFGAVLAQQMAGHGIAEVVIGRGTSATELLLLLKALAVEVGAYPPGDGVAQRLAAAGASGIAVLGARSAAASGDARREGVTQAFELAELEERAVEAPREPVPADQAPNPEPVPVPAAGGGASGVQPIPPEPLPVAEPQGVRPASAFLPAPSGIPSDTLIGSALGALLRNPYGWGVLDRLSDLAREIDNTLREGRLELAVQAMAAVVGLEPAAPEGTARTSYAIVLRRVLTEDALRRVAHLLPDPRFTPVATAVLQRAGPDATAVLVDLLSSSDVPLERRAFLAVLRLIPRGADAVVHVLGHSQWFVVRNVAELLGEMRVEEAVLALTRLLAHRESRVQRAAAIALAKIGTAATVEPLRRTLHEGSPELRGAIAASVGGAHARALVPPLVALSEAEENADVRAEYYRALGRIGAPEAVDALVKAVQPGGRVFGRRATGPRVAAVEGLRDAGGVAARQALQSLTGDADKVVREAAARALAGGAGRGAEVRSA